MPLSAEALKEIGVELNEEQSTKFSALLESHVNEQTEGIKANRDALLEEKREAKRLADEAAEQVRIAKEEKAKKDGDYETLMSLREEDSKKAQERFESIMRERSNERKSSVVNELASQFENPKAAKLMLSGLVDVQFDSDGKITETYKNDDFKAIENGRDGFTDFLKKTPEYASMLKGVDSKGAGANGGDRKPAPSTKKRSTMTREEKHAYIQEHGQKEFLKLPK